MLTRKAIRQQCLLERQALPKEVREQASRQICQMICALEVYKKATHIALYQAIDAEVDLSFLWQHAEGHGKSCYMPVIQHDKTLSFCFVTQDTSMQSNCFNIQEPDALVSRVIAPEHLDLMVMPLVAFDVHGTRLGRGAGYYDRTLEKERPSCLLGVAYACQQQPLIRPEPWDVALTGVVTEVDVYWCRD